MANLDLYLKNLTGKDEKNAQQAAFYLIDNVDLELFKMLVEKSDYLFDFVRNNVCSRIEKAVNKNNFKNLLKFFDVYSPYYDDLFAHILANHADENLTDNIFELLEKGTNAQRAYAAKYFYYIPDTISIELLSKYAFSDDESLAYNAAEALGQMSDDVSYDKALSLLSEVDDFDKLKAVKFFVAYGQKYPLTEIFNAMKTSKMPENIAGQIPYMQSFVELLSSKEYKIDTLIALDNILSGLGEILPLSDIFQFELFELLEILIHMNKIENSDSGEIAEVLLKAYSKFMLFTENQEYIFDEDKNTKQEIDAIWKMLKGQNEEFWNAQKHFVVSELNEEKERVLSVLPVIAEFNIKEATDGIRKLLETNDDEVVICETLSTLKAMQVLELSDIQKVENKIQNPNIKAIIENLKSLI